MLKKLRPLIILFGILIVLGLGASMYEVFRTIRVTERMSGIKPSDTQAIPYLVARLGDYNSVIRAKAAQELAGLGPAAKPAYEDLTRALKDPSAQVRANATAAFMHIGDAACIPKLIEGLDDEDNEVRRYSACALRDNAKLASASVPRLTELLDDPWMGPWAAAALGEIGPPAKVSIPKIIAKLQTANDLSRLEYIVALQKFGSDAKAALPFLQTLTNDPDPLISQAATKAVQSITGAVAPAKAGG
jgi:HEAT repeat protein